MAFAETQSLAADFIQSEASTRILWQPLGDSQCPCLYADAGLFFAQPVIIREEALFQGIDALLSSARVSIPSRTVKRKNIRRFSEGAISAADLGPVRIKKNSQQIILSLSLVPSPQGGNAAPPVPFPQEYGFSLLINKPGLYTLKGTAIEVCENPASGNEGESVFFAFLPLVMRPGFKEDTVKCQGKTPANCVAAVDMTGTAACICQGKLAWRRDSAAVAAAVAATAAVSNNGGLCMVRIAGSEDTDVR